MPHTAISILFILKSCQPSPAVDHQHLLQQAAHHYSFDPTQARLIRSNTNWIFDAGDLILRLTPADVRSIDEVKMELDWVTSLAAAGVDVATIIPSKTGNPTEYLKEVEGPEILVAFQKIAGEKIPPTQWNEAHFQRLGRLTGQLHRLSLSYQPPHGWANPHWDEIPEHPSGPYLPVDDRCLADLYDHLTSLFQAYPRESGTYGLVHYDIHQGNYLLTKDDRLFLFDFEMACRSWFSNDVAIVLYYAAYYPSTREEPGFEDRFLTHFWRGYEQEYQLPAAEKEKIPLFLLYRDLLVLGYLEKIGQWKEASDPTKAFKARLESSILRRREQLAL